METKHDWTGWRDQLKDELKVASAAIKGYDGVGRDRHEHAFVLLLNRATENLGAIVCLFESGWENDAMSLMRTLTDIYIDIHYLQTDRSVLLERFYDYSIVANKWKKESTQSLYGRSVDDLIREDYARADENGSVRDDVCSADEYVAAYHAEVARAETKWEFRRSGWARHDAAAKARLIDQKRADGQPEAQRAYDLIYRMTSEALHSGIGGALRSVTMSRGAAILEHEARPPLPRGLLVLAFASFMFMKVLDVANEELDLKANDGLRRINEQHKTLAGPVRVPAAMTQSGGAGTATE
jgi:hypothetical protein